ncbi:MAG: DUF4157 domain-containing protein, partial [Terriglobales bacterium]
MSRSHTAGFSRSSDSDIRGAAVAGVLQRKCACGQHTGGGEQCEECKKKGMTLQRESNGSGVSGTVPPVVHEVLKSPGRPLDPGTRAFMEPRFGQDFSQVRLHTDTKAADSASAVKAHAYTVGQDIVFGPGQYSPHAEASRHLLAHELTHVVQQTASGVGADSETMASAAADRVSRGQAVDGALLGGAPVSLQRSPKDDTAGRTGVVGSAGDSAEPPVDEFDFDKTDIPPQHLARLAALKTRLLNAPGATVILTGHTDTVGKEKYNEDLGRRRAKAVRDFLSAKKGVNPSRIEIKSRGELDPAAGQPPAKVDPDKGERNPKNRRVEVRVTGLPPAKDWMTFDPTGTNKRKRPNLNLPPDYVIPPSTPTPTPKPGDKSPASSSSQPPKKEGGPEVEAAIVAGPGGIETTVEVTWEAPSGLGKKLGSEIKFTLHVGPKGFEQLEADLTILKKKIKDAILGGTIRELTFSLGFNPGLNLDKDTAGRLVTSFSEKAK